MKIVTQAQERRYLLEGEKHHIIPRSIGGNNSKQNIVKLTYREHFICHLLLTKMTVGKAHTKMCFALKFMTATNHNQTRYVPNSKLFEIVKKRFIEARRNSSHTVQSRAKTSKSMQGNTNKLGKKHSASAKLKVSAAFKGRVYVHLDNITRFVTPTQATTLIAEGWLPNRSRRD